MVDVTDIKGIGPSKAETLAEEGYDSVESIANADPEELASVDGVGEDRGLEFIVEAENVLESDETETDDETDEFDLKPSEVGDEVEDLTEDSSDDAESASDDEDDESPSDDEEVAENDESDSEEPEKYPVEIEFETHRQFDVFHASVMRYYERHHNGNQPVSDAMDKIINGIDSLDSVEYELTEEELNALHSALSQQRTNYQGSNIIDHMDELNVVLEKVNEFRREYLF